VDWSEKEEPGARRGSLRSPRRQDPGISAPTQADGPSIGSIDGAGRADVATFVSEAGIRHTSGCQSNSRSVVQPVAIRAPVGSCGYWTLIASIRKRPGEGKNALLALLSVAEVKLAIVTDDDIDIHNPDDLDWAMTFRVQADRDLIVVQGARGKHIDPSIKSWELGKGGLPTTAKLGIDATIPEGVPKKLYRRIRVYGQDRVKPEEYR
jgi:2,5-furandicarboxylate decarboxylase 1